MGKLLIGKGLEEPIIYIFVCASALIMCAIIMSRTLLQCNLASVDFRRLLFVATMSSLAQLRVQDGYREAEAV